MTRALQSPHLPTRKRKENGRGVQKMSSLHFRLEGWIMHNACFGTLL
jgi:hypothetical protein